MQTVGRPFPTGKLQIFHAPIWILQHSRNVFLISDIQLKPTIDKPVYLYFMSLEYPSLIIELSLIIP